MRRSALRRTPKTWFRQPRYFYPNEIAMPAFVAAAPLVAD
jgi:hypothetical protein